MNSKHKGDNIVNIEFEPLGRRIQVSLGTRLLEAAQQTGLDLVAVCGGNGTCGSCKIRLIEGQLSTITEDEKDQLSEEELAQNFRLACRAIVESDARLDVPSQSLSTPQRTQVEGQVINVTLDPAVVPFDLVVQPPNLVDQTPDFERLKQALPKTKPFHLSTPGFAVLNEVSDHLRSQGWKARLAMRQILNKSEIAAVLPVKTPLLGLAVDAGTTKLAAYLVNLENGEVLGRLGAMNPQIAYGEDVIARIAYANDHEKGNKKLQSILIDAINDMASTLCEQAHFSSGQIVDAVIVGNTIIHHLLCGLAVKQLGVSPYICVTSSSLQIPARDLGLHFSTGAHVYLPPIVAGYVGPDHISMLLATRTDRSRKIRLAMDIGTNTEICLAVAGRLFCCSCASGPAFEGAHIHAGMRAAPGAIERVQITDGQINTFSIGGVPAVGICGSGILDAVSEMHRAGLIDHTGRLLKSSSAITTDSAGLSGLVLVPAAHSGIGQDIRVTRKDINEIQLAKSAIRTGAEILMETAGVSSEDLDEIVIAGAFGTYLDLTSALNIGMLPPLNPKRIHQVGNAAGAGAQMLLLSKKERLNAQRLASKLEYIELTTHPRFTHHFVENLSF